jgi:CRP-like cAMP-binding protein
VAVEGEPITDNLFVDELMSVLEDAFPSGLEAPLTEPIVREASRGAQIVVSPLFRHFSVDEMVAVIAGLHLLTRERGQVILREGEVGNSLFMLSSGKVKAFKKNAAGKQMPIAEMEEGAFFGEGSILTRKPRTASIVATTQCELLELDRPTLDSICKTHPHVMDVMREFAAQRTGGK